MESRYVWGDWEVTSRQMEHYWCLLNKQEAFGSARIVTTGISKGGEVAIWSVLSGLIPAQRFVAIAPGGPRIENPKLLLPYMESCLDRGMRTYLIVGNQNTGCYAPTMRLAGFLEEQGIPVELEVHHGHGHWFPPGFEHRLQRGLEFITEGSICQSISDYSKA